MNQVTIYHCDCMNSTRLYAGTVPDPSNLLVPWSMRLCGGYRPFLNWGDLSTALNTADDQAGRKLLVVHLNDFLGDTARMAQLNQWYRSTLATSSDEFPERMIIIYSGLHTTWHECNKKVPFIKLELDAGQWQKCWAMFPYSELSGRSRHLAWLAQVSSPGYPMHEICRDFVDWKSSWAAKLTGFPSSGAGYKFNAADFNKWFAMVLSDKILIHILNSDDMHPWSKDTLPNALDIGNQLWLLEGVVDWRPQKKYLRRSLEILWKFVQPAGGFPGSKSHWQQTRDEFQELLNEVNGIGKPGQPPANQHIEVKSGPSVTTASGSGYKILMVDDAFADEQDKDVRSIKDKFEQLPDVSVFFTASHAQQALNICNEKKPDLIFLDRMWSASWKDKEHRELLVDSDTGKLPVEVCNVDTLDYQGLGILQYLRNNGVDIPVIFCTSSVNRQDGIRAKQAGALAYNSKDDIWLNPENIIYIFKGYQQKKQPDKQGVITVENVVDDLLDAQFACPARMTGSVGHPATSDLPQALANNSIADILIDPKDYIALYYIPKQRKKLKNIKSEQPKERRKIKIGVFQQILSRLQIDLKLAEGIDQKQEIQLPIVPGTMFIISLFQFLKSIEISELTLVVDQSKQQVTLQIILHQAEARRFWNGIQTISGRQSMEDFGRLRACNAKMIVIARAKERNLRQDQIQKIEDDWPPRLFQPCDDRAEIYEPLIDVKFVDEHILCCSWQSDFQDNTP